jgi:fimbrial chaperone protein
MRRSVLAPLNQRIAEMQIRAITLLAPLLAFLLGAAPSAYATSVSPMHLEMMSVGHAGRSQFTVANTGTEPMPMETTVKRVDIDENGTSHQTPADEDFLVFPTQIIIPPGGSQVFRVQWVGEPNLASSQTYMIGVSQIPLKQPNNKSVVQVVMSFGVVVDVAPPEGHSNLQVTGATIVTDKKGKRHVAFTVSNSSNVHGLLDNAVVTISSGGWSKSYSSGEIAQGIGIGIVQPGKRRVFTLPGDLPADVSALQVRLDQPKQ